MAPGRARKSDPREAALSAFGGTQMNAPTWQWTRLADRIAADVSRPRLA